MWKYYVAGQQIETKPQRSKEFKRNFKRIISKQYSPYLRIRVYIIEQLVIARIKQRQLPSSLSIGSMQYNSIYQQRIGRFESQQQLVFVATTLLLALGALLLVIDASRANEIFLVFEIGALLPAVSVPIAVSISTLPHHFMFFSHRRIDRS